MVVTGSKAELVALGEEGAVVDFEIAEIDDDSDGQWSQPYLRGGVTGRCPDRWNSRKVIRYRNSSQMDSETQIPAVPAANSFVCCVSCGTATFVCPCWDSLGSDRVNGVPGLESS